MGRQATLQPRLNNGTIRSNAVCLYFCRKLLEDGLVANKRSAPQQNGVRNGTIVPNVVEPETPDNSLGLSLRRLLLNNSDSLNNDCTVTALKLWNRGDYSPIEVLIDNASAIDHSGPVSVQSSSIASGQSLANDLYEVEVLDRVNVLRRQGKWSLTRLPLCLDAPRVKTHWDYLLEEMTVMQIDFSMEFNAKRTVAKILAHSAKKYVDEKAAKKRRALVLSNPSEESAIGETRVQEQQCPSLLSGSKNVATIPNLPDKSVAELRSRVAEWSQPLQLECKHQLPKNNENSPESMDIELLDGYDSFRTHTLTYNQRLLETDPKLTSAICAGWRNWDNNEPRFNEDAQICDSLSNPWYSGEVIEPDEIEYQKSTYSGDEDLLMDLMDEQENFFVETDRSPKSTDDSMDLPSASTSADVSQQPVEYSNDFLNHVQPLATRPNMPLDHEPLPTKRPYRPPRRSDELQRRLTGNQVLVLGDPHPLVRPDGKPGFTPAHGETEWIDTDIPLWGLIEDYMLLAQVVRQLRAMPIPLYVARNFCINWDLVSKSIRKFAFHDRTQYRCCMHFRELIGAQKKLAPTENIDIPMKKVDGIDIKMMHDPRVKASTLPITRCFVRSLATLTRKYNDLKRAKLTWQTRTDWLQHCDQKPKYKVLKSFAERDNCIFNQTAQVKFLQRNKIDVNVRSPSQILSDNKKALPLEQFMVYHQYSRRLRISRVLATSKVIMMNAVNPVQQYSRIMPASRSTSMIDGIVFSVNDDNKDKFSQIAYTRHYFDNFKTQQIIERRLFWSNPSTQLFLNRELELKIQELLSTHVMLLAIDIRTPVASSQNQMVDIVNFASKHLGPKLVASIPIGQNDLRRLTDNFDFSIDDDLRQKLHDALKSNSRRISKNGKVWIPIEVDGQFDNHTKTTSSGSQDQNQPPTTTDLRQSKSTTKTSKLKRIIEVHQEKWLETQTRPSSSNSVIQLALQVQLQHYNQQFLPLQVAALRQVDQNDGAFVFACDRNYEKNITINGKPLIRLNVQRTLKKNPTRVSNHL
ncbi:HSA and SNF2-related and DNA RNA helicase domain containing protein, protein [Aphelenchoides besseyi]|nr:HSA and SNF2-related and DNA RNA helicase domain containing protein, protein [Aphelenchoides besseyi]KAI6235950.1 HSA and SNF2-related and DNA RNA helicase domain containing protein, protein [Aphelenchoides besseyi]